MTFKDHYATLQVLPTADHETIKKAYRRLSKQYHPDVNPDPSATEMFKKIAEAYEILGDENKRKAYDTKTMNTGPAGSRGFTDHFSDSETRWQHQNDFAGAANFFSKARNQRYDRDGADYLLLEIEERIDLAAILNTRRDVSIKYSKTWTNLNSRTKSPESATIKFEINSMSEDLNIRYDNAKGEYYFTKTFPKQGNYEVFTLDNFSWQTGPQAQVSKIFGDLQVKFWLDIPAECRIDGGTIFHAMEVNLADLLYKEKLKLVMADGKAGEVKLADYSYLNDLKIRIPNAGLFSKGARGHYIFELKVPALKPGNLSDKERTKFESLLRKMI